MPSSQKWVKTPKIGQETSMNSKVVMSFSQVNTLYQWLLVPPVSSLILGDYTKWCSSLTFYPFDVPSDSEGTWKLSVGGQTKTGINCSGTVNVKAYLGFTLGETLYPAAVDFTDYEPYVKLQLWLPFYGFCDLKVAEVQGKYIQFRLYIDFNTGQAQYIVGVNASSVSSPNAPYLLGTDDTNTRILGTYVFQLGVDIPFTQAGTADMLRNASLAAIKGAATIGASAIASASGADIVKSTNTQHQVTKIESMNKSGRGRKTATVDKTTTDTRTTDYGNYAKQRRISTAAQTGADVLANMHLNVQCDKSNNSVVNSATCPSVVLIKRKVQPTVDRLSSNYLKFYGAPLGQVKTLGDLTGYTEVSEIHFEGEGFSQATAREIAMLEQAFSDGVIL